MTDKLVEALEATQADRDAALRYYLYTRSLSGNDYRVARATNDFLSGNKDQTETVQAFARHRFAALASRPDTGAVAAENEAVTHLRSTFQRWLNEGLNAQPLMPSGMRPWSTGDLKWLVEQLSKPLYAHPPAAVAGEGGDRLIHVDYIARAIAKAAWEAIRPVGGKFWSELPDDMQTLAVCAARDGYSNALSQPAPDAVGTGEAEDFRIRIGDFTVSGNLDGDFDYDSSDMTITHHGSVCLDEEDQELVTPIVQAGYQMTGEMVAEIIVGLCRKLALSTPPRQPDDAVRALKLAQPIVEADYHAACDTNDADWEGMSKAALDAVNAALAATKSPEADGGVSEELQPCTLPPEGWICARGAGLSGLCAARRPSRWDGVAELVDLICSDEGATVTFTGQNPDFNGLPNECVFVCGPTTGWKDRDFHADTLTDCLRAALVTPDTQAQGEG